MDIDKVQQALRALGETHERDLKALRDRNAELQENVSAAEAKAVLADSNAAQERSAKDDALTELGRAQDALVAEKKKAAADIAGLKHDNEFLARHDRETRTENERLREIVKAQAKVAA